MICHNILCKNYNSHYADNCQKINFHVADCPDLIFKKDCSNCLHFRIYEGCPILMECKNLTLWEEAK